VYAVCCLPSVTLGKVFAECFLGFALCLGHTAKIRFPVVTLLYIVLYFLNDLMFRDKIIIISPIGFTRAVVSYSFFFV